MLTDSDRSAADREARNEYLIDIDEAWEACRDAVEGARDSYEEALDSGRVAFEELQSAAAVEHSDELDKAWANYKQTVSNAPSENRRQVIADARAAYNEAAEALRTAYNDVVSTARAAYAETTENVRLSYEATVDTALGAHREAIQSVRKFMQPGSGGKDSAGIDLTDLENDLVARASNGHSDKSSDLGELDQSEIDALAENALSSLS